MMRCRPGTVPVRNGPGSAVHRSASLHAAPHPGHEGPGRRMVPSRPTESGVNSTELTAIREETMNGGMEGAIDRKRLIIPALGDLYDAIAPYSYAIIRFVA